MTALTADLMKQLQADYMATFAEKLKAIKMAYSKKQWMDLAEIFHKLAGSGATYMMPEITELSREVENYLQNSPAPSIPIVEKSISLLEEIFKCRQKGERLDIGQLDFLKKTALKSS